MVGPRYDLVLVECQHDAGREAAEKIRAHGRADGPTSCPTISSGLSSRGACVVVSVWGEMWEVALLQRHSLGP